MAVPYIFCRYDISLNDEGLDASGQKSFFEEGQGQRLPYKRRGSSDADANVFFCEVSATMVDEFKALDFQVGLQPGIRTVVGLDSEGRRRTRKTDKDTHIKFAHVIMLPDHKLMAVQDRANDACISSRTCLAILRSVFHGQDGDFSVIHLSDGEVRHAVNTWNLVQYQYSVRPLNPISLSDLTNLRSDGMKLEHVAKETATLTAAEGHYMTANGGPISQTQEMVDVGYGQNGFKGWTPDGHLGHVPKPAFHMEKAKNLKEREKPRFLRIMFDGTEGSESANTPTIARSLMRFYYPDDQTS